MTRRESSCSPCSSSAQSCEDLRCRSIPTYTITGPPSVEGRLGRGISPPRPERLGGPLLHDISPRSGTVPPLSPAGTDPAGVCPSTFLGQSLHYSRAVTAERELDGQVALVTGGGRGVGAFIARELAAAGARVAVSARTQEQVAGIAREIGGLAIVADVTD